MIDNSHSEGKLTNSQVDRLGDRLRRGSRSEADLAMLDEFRRSFSETYDSIVNTIRKRIPVELTGRPAKSTNSIIEKLNRESIRLSQIQDIAGCRLVVNDANEQNRIVAALCEIFSQADVVDRRLNPSHGYRAVHVIVTVNGKSTEIQIRSIFQHRWAELSEKLTDVVDRDIKYGGGPIEVRNYIQELTQLVASYEDMEIRLGKFASNRISAQLSPELDKLQNSMNEMKQKIEATFIDSMRVAENGGGKMS